ncbi:hypothetical protein [Xenorhabdus miraniensis]|uniref:Uncharacterized protein n=1 Tax=Xenorhabdus miraniensis TaxID=351674 RepID=A0A2D0JW46_9GAMM|nr:hypothetical protein [Xenorhabdus miraniensis]PHM50538.1 hypothetical protein Xmir_00722 [Xenorhabdus miraniensis]
MVRLFFGCGVTFSGKPAKSDALSLQTVSKSRVSVEMPAGTAKRRKVKGKTVATG